MSAVLLVGEDDLLQQTRAAVLRTTGAATICSKAASALDVLRTRQYDLIVLCHTVPEASCILLAETIHSSWPDTPVLLITRTTSWNTSGLIQEINEVSSADPQRLVNRTVQLLAQRPHSNVNPLRTLH